MNSLNRRHFLKTSFLSSLYGLTGCHLEGHHKPFKVFWLHLEGAPLRTPFDLWLDPFDHEKSLKGPIENAYIHRYGTKFKIPKVWVNESGDASPIIDNLLMVRGLTSKSPHLKECRKEWFSSPEFINLLKDMGKDNFSFLGQNDALNNTFTQIFGEEKKRAALSSSSSRLINTWADQTSKTNPGLLPIFSSWYQELNKKKGDTSGLVLSIVNSFGKAPQYFENLSVIDEDTLGQTQLFYGDLIKGLEAFIHELKVYRLFDQTMILITSDRARVLTQNEYPLKSEPLWQGLNFSLIGGALKGPLTLGHIAKSHPLYSESYPGTWGMGLNDWTPNNVHQLLADLCIAKSYNAKAKWSSVNPWLDLKPLGSILVKLPPGKIF
ncbi:MAG: hypothetical protein K9K67_10625 [Bacteriovoracaceae bacterium]|nr:hypothetical protein [Bacteriovoracaceae bacterium]